MEFPKDFLWGVASSAYQTEGYPTADGGGLSIWDTFCKKQGTIADESDGSIATDSYHRFEEDIALIRKMGLSVYRFSISWARLDPHGTGEWNEKGFEFYQKLINCCHENNVIPYVTLYHWELPQAIEDQGGWRSRNTAFAFERYAKEVANRFKGIVENFITLNEIQCTILLGHLNGVHAPGLKSDLATQFSVLHHQLLAHGLATGVIREIIPSAKIGIASTGRICYPKTTSDDDIVASMTAFFDCPDDDWTFTHQMVLDPVCLGHYPENMGKGLTALASKLDPKDLTIISKPIDFIGLNIYNGNEVFAGEDKSPVYSKKPQGHAITALGWGVTPEVMQWGTRYIYNRYSLPIYITENGMSCHDTISLDNEVHDPNRIDFLTRYLRELYNAIDSGVDIKGYFHWSLADNFEWNAGYCQRFGLVYVDYSNCDRTLKNSGIWYKNVAATNGKSLF